MYKKLRQKFPRHSRLRSGMTLSREEIAQGVDSCETVLVPLRDDMGICHPELVSGSQNNESLPCERGGRSPLLDSEPTQSIKSQTKLDRLRWRDLEEQSPLEFPPLARGAKVAAKAAFTLAEVLITLSIIGIVAALTIPSLIENHNEKAWSTAKDLWQKKLVEATRQMNIDGVMTGVAGTTEDFMNDFKKYVKVIKTCDNSKLKNCYAPKIVQTAGDEVEVSGLKTSNSLGQKWNTNTMGFVIADGTTVIMAYNPNCDSVDPFSKEGQNGQVGCMSMLIDVNGKKAPNRVGKDILLSNASISKSGCDIKLGDLCLAGSDIYPITTISTCEGNPGHKYDTRPDSQNTYCSTSYWGGAQKACEDLGMRLPTMQELADIATYIYKQEDNPIGAKENRSNITPDSSRTSETAWSTNASGYWSIEPYGDNGAYIRDFYSYGSTYGHGMLRSNGRARCLAN